MYLLFVPVFHCPSKCLEANIITGFLVFVSFEHMSVMKLFLFVMSQLQLLVGVFTIFNFWLCYMCLPVYIVSCYITLFCLLSVFVKVLLSVEAPVESVLTCFGGGSTKKGVSQNGCLFLKITFWKIIINDC